ncbi:putative kinesin heavy chain [Cryptosporidium canis]|uniref:Kinesin heavy chain n=1 Tax=Cryptosporidium canis TaxID=195482 RepID=A0ABQ8PA60_9CRYT|nr:putative kinesin heavy chain [Cryptosporidium canis]
MKRDSLMLFKDTEMELRKNCPKQSEGELTSHDCSGSHFDADNSQQGVATHSKSSFSVAIRFRPAIYHENMGIDNHPIWELSNKSVFDISKKTNNYFDHVFDENSTNQMIYDQIVKNAVRTCFSGINVTICAYGQTSSGKTHTMFGDNQGSYDGIIPLSINEIFNFSYSKYQPVKGKNKITVSYLEVYNEKLFDLLVPQTNFNSNESNYREIKIIDGVDGAVEFVNLTTKSVSSPEDVHSIIKTGLKLRRVAETAMNERSSRSHTILRIKIESKLDSNDTCVGILNFVDLAGSESIKRTQLEGDRRKEGLSINRSLLALSQVISQLSENSLTETSTNSFSSNIPTADCLSQPKNKYINYRDSKITRILSDSLGGNSRTIIICNCSPDRVNYYETLSTIDFAKRAKKIQNKVKVNILKPSEEKYEILKLKQKLSKHVENTALLNKEIEILKSERDQLAKRLSISKNELDESHYKSNNPNIKLNNCIHPECKDELNHILLEYAEIIDLKSQNITYLDEEINTMQLKSHNIDKLLIENNEMKAEINRKNSQIVQQESKIDHLSNLFSEMSNKLTALEASLDCKNVVIEKLLLKNEKTSISCVELKKKLDILLIERLRYINWYIRRFNDKGSTENSGMGFFDENLELLLSAMNNYLDFTQLFNCIPMHDTIDHLELLHFENEIAQLETEINHYEIEKIKIDSEIFGYQLQTANNLNSAITFLTELLCTLLTNRRNVSLDGSLQVLSVPDSYEIKRKMRNSEKTVKVLESELNEKKNIELRLKIFQLEAERIKKENIKLYESLYILKQENKELKVSVENLRHELELKSISVDNFQNINHEIFNTLDSGVNVLAPSKTYRSIAEKSIAPTSTGYQEKKIEQICDLKENDPNENITDSTSNYLNECPKDSISSGEENHITECNTQ